MENSYKLYDYNINLNDVIQLIVNAKREGSPEEKATSSDNVKKKDIKKTKIEEESVDEEELLEAQSLFYKIGDAVDGREEVHGAWFEAIVHKIVRKGEQILYNVHNEFDDKFGPCNVSEESIRPRARRVLSLDELSVGQKVMINYNVDDPKNIGLWYDFVISKIDRKRRSCELTGTLHMSRYVFHTLLIISLCLHHLCTLHNFLFIEQLQLKFINSLSIFILSKQ